jgi:hypothetical protein
MRKSLFLFLLFFPALLFSQVSAEKKLLSQMLTACDQFQGAKYFNSITERKKNGETNKKELSVKIKAHPVQIYVYCLKPDSGAEVLWRSGELNNQALIHPNKFPYVNLKMELYNSLLRKDDHHTLRELGFDYIGSMIGHYRNKLGVKFYSYLSIKDTIQWEGRRLIRLVFDYTDFAYLPYTVKEGENASTIGIQNYVNEYMIVCANEKVKDFHDVKEGQQIVIPNCFGKKVIFGIDSETMLPLLQEVYDEKGLFEKYELKGFQFNPKFEADEFTPDFKGYHF